LKARRVTASHGHGGKLDLESHVAAEKTNLQVILKVPKSNLKTGAIMIKPERHGCNFQELELERE
jgi:hypothetical protein